MTYLLQFFTRRSFALQLCAVVFLLSARSNAAIIFQDDFESGSLGSAWVTSKTNDGRATVTSSFAPASGSKHLVLDDAVNDATYSVAEATLILNLSGAKNVVLNFKGKSLGNEPHSPPNSLFYSSRTYDGVAISTNGGSTWRTVQPLDTVSTAWTSYSIDLDAILAYSGGSFGPDFRIRFSEYDNAPAPLDGIAIDDVVVTGDQQIESLLEMPSPLIEGTGTQTGYVVLSSYATNDVVLQLITSPSGQLSLPQTVTVPAGANSASFDFSVVDDDVVNLTRDITVTATASGIAAQPATVTIYDDEAPTLSVTLPAQVSEGAHTSVDNATVTLSHAGTAPLTVALSASPASQLSVQPTSVTVPAGQTQASFKVDAVDDNAIDGNVAASVIASAPGIQTGSAQTLTMDNDPRALGLSLPATIQEDKMASATVTIAGTFSAAVVVHLSSSDPAVASIPATVTVPAGALSNTFAITPADNAVRDGSRNFMINAEADTFSSASAVTTIRDNEVAAYRVSVATDVVDISNPAPFTVSATDIEGNVIIGTGGTTDVVLVQSNGSTQAASPATLTLTGTQTTGSTTVPPNLAAPLRIRVTDADGNTGESRPFDTQRVLALTTADLIWDSLRQRIYASIPSNAPTYANQIVAIDPSTLQVTGSVVVGQNPGQMALTSGGEALYVAQNANGAVARVDLQSMTVVSSFSLGSSGQGVNFAKDLCTVVGQPNLVVVLRGQTSPGTLTVYDNGVARPNTISAYAAEPSGEAAIVFAQPNYAGDFSRVQVNGNGLTTVATSPTGYIAATSMAADKNIVTSSSGYEIDGATARSLGKFPFAGSSIPAVPRPDSAGNRVYFIEPKSSDYSATYNAIGSYDPVSLALVRRVLIPEITSAASFIRFGANGLGFRTSNTVVLMNAGQIVPAEAPADLALSVDATPSSPPAGAPVSYTLHLTNQGPNPARGALVIATLSAGQTITGATASAGTTSFEPGVVRLAAGDIPVGGVVSVTINATPAASAGSVSCTALASSNSLDPNFANDTAFKLVPVAYQFAQDVVNQIAVNVNNLIYDPLRNRIWATVPRSAGAPIGGSVVAIDPTDGTVSEPIPLNGEPRPISIALSGNARYLYVGLTDAAEVVRVDLESPGNPRLRIPMGGPATSPIFPEDIEVLDGDGTSFLVTGANNAGAFVFDGTVRRPNNTSSYTVDRIERTTTPNVFVGAQTGTGSGQLNQLTVTASGVAVTKFNSGVMSVSSLGDMRASGDVVLSHLGQLVDSKNLILQGNFGASGAPCLDAPNGRGYLATGTTLRGFELSTGTPLGTLPLPGAVVDYNYGTAPTLIRWGLDGLALTGVGKLYLTRWSATIPSGLDQNGDHVSDAWEVAYFGTTNVDLHADPDRDALPNVFEYFFATSPLQSNGNPLQIGIEDVAGGGEIMHLIFPRRAGISSSDYRYEVSVDLKQWSPASAVTESVLRTQTVNGVQIQTIDAAIPAPNGARSFARLKWLGP